MEEKFDRLVSSLSRDERQNLLDKLRNQSNISNEPLYLPEDEKLPEGNLEAEYARLPWFSRLWYSILSIFRSKSPVDTFADHKVSILGFKIEEKSPGLYDYQRRLLLPPFYRHLEKLREAARFFYTALDSSVNRDKGALFAFLGSLEMPDVHERLQTETYPDFIMEKRPDIQETELRQIALKAMDDALLMINEEYRNVMYFDARSLNCLKELSSFLFDRIIMAFSFDSSEGGETCPANVVREPLASLNNILLSLKVVPPMPLLQSLFVFVLQERSAEHGFDINREIRMLLAKANDSISVIRDFNKNVPLTWIIRCLTRDMSVSPREISGGEDWFVNYREYWKRKVESLFAEHMKERRHRELLDSFRFFLKGRTLRTLENSQTESNPDGIPVKGTYALSFLLTFYSAIFMPDINRFLRPILIDGDFHRKENGIVFAESYNELIKLEDIIKKFERKISTSGDYGERYSQARQEMSALPIKRRKIQIILGEASEEAEKIIQNVREASQNMIDLVNGILGRDTRGKYDTLVNLARLAGKDNQFNIGLNETVNQFETTLRLLEDIEALESGK
jgi:hypothetical protein